ncbi:MAG: hypothetical protein JSV78_04270 [Phycisphaerales bacterium]|nr:MAG: hypothetical protein JSV78_04270 [Phycisphaerales bacterium]
MQESRLITRLHALRRRIRTQLIVYGLCAVGAGGVVAFLTILALDWFLELPAVPRIVIALTFLVGLLIAVVYWIVRPLQARLGIDELAGRLERRFRHLEDRVTSTVNFLQNREAGSTEMMDRVIADTDRMVADLPFEAALTLKPLARITSAFVLVIAVLAVFVACAPGWASTGMFRYLYPLGEFEWPRRVAIEPITHDEVVAIGESITVRMRVTRGLHRDLRGVVHLREPDASKIKLAMRRDKDDSFYATIDAVTTDLTCWFEAGDADTRRSPFHITAVPRPEVAEATITVGPPPYAFDRPPRILDLREGDVQAPVAAQITLDVRSSKPTPVKLDDRRIGLDFEEGPFIPFTAHAEDRRNLSAAFEVMGDARFRIVLVDEFGLENSGVEEHRIVAVPDKAPVVTILEPKAVTEMTPTGSVPVHVNVEDDFGITGLELDISRAGVEQAGTVSLTNRLVRGTSENAVKGEAQYLWSIEPLGLAPGDFISFQAVATDNCTLTGETGQVGRSAPMRLKIISDAEFEVRIRDDLVLLEDRIRRSMLDQAELLDRTRELVRNTPPSEPLSEVEREHVDGFAGRQARLVRRSRDLARRLFDLNRRMELNKAGDKEFRRQIESLAGALQEVAADPMTSAANSLNEARDRTRAEDQQRALEATTIAQQEAVDRLRTLIRSMAQWGDFHGLLTKTRGFLDRQRSIREQTTELGKSSVGKSVESLSPEETAKLNRARRQQEQLAEEVDQLLAKMQQLAGQLQDKDPSGADAVQAAARAAKAGEVPKRLRSAGQALKQNRAAAAALDQKLAEDGIQKMIDALKDREKRELALLRKRVADAEEQVTQLIEQQQALRDATAEAETMNADQAVYEDFQQRQRTLARNARMLGEELTDLPRGAEAAQSVRQAAEPMGEAEMRLRDQDGSGAVEQQDAALALLRKALEILEELSRQADEEALRRSLAEIRDQLSEMLEAQKVVNEGVHSLFDDVQAKGRITRLEARQATRLSRQQSDVLELVEQLRPELQKVVVYEWALERVTGWMQTSRTWLTSRKIDEDLIALTERIVRELERLIDAIEETQAMPLTSEFVEQAGGGGGGGAGAIQGKPVPTIAELLVLKAMQADITERTRSLGETVELKEATEEQLRELKTLGEDQAQVRRLTEMVTQRARQP